MSEETRKIRKYMEMLEHVVLILGKEGNDAQREFAEYRIKGFARRIADERMTMWQVGDLLKKQADIEEQLRTMRQDFPHLFLDETR